MPTSFLLALGGPVAVAIAVAFALAGAVRADTTPSDTTPTATTPTTTIPTATTPPIPVQVTRATVGRPVAPGFLGFSFEYRAVRDYTGSDPNAINPTLVQLIRNLAPHQSPILRIGGNSADETWLPTRGVKRSPGLKYTLTRSWMATTRALAQKTGGRLILDLNLKLDSAAEMLAEARAFSTQIGDSNIAAVEIGNEPELYPITPFYYRGPNKTPVYPRRRSYGRATYLREVTGFANLLKGFTLAGPATGNFTWLTSLPKLFAAEPKLKVVTYHRYPLIRCFSQPTDPGFPSIPNLLTLTASRDLLNGAGPYIALAHRHGATFRVDELNSVACKGQTGVSDTFASALWMLDTLFAMARSGVDGVNIHTLPEAVYHPFTFQRVNGRWQATVFPEYYGLLLFAQAAPAGSRLLTVSIPAGMGEVRARATLTPTGVIHVVLINDDLTADHTVALRAPVGAAQTATVERLSAPSLDATDGVTLAGQGFGTETTTGTLEGPFDAAQLQPTDGQYEIDLPAHSAAMVIFAPARPGG
jgi:Glycosyl hydrolase family 79 C-terminal beta domain